MRKRALAMVLLLAACSGNGSTSSSWRATNVVDAVSGKSVTLKDALPEQVTFMALWSVWCGPCKEELPRLEQVFKEHQVAVVGVNIGDDADAVSEYVRSINVSFPMYRDENSDLLSALKVPAVPATFAVDASGKIVWTHLGALSAEDLQSQVDQLLASN